MGTLLQSGLSYLLDFFRFFRVPRAVAFFCFDIDAEARRPARATGLFFRARFGIERRRRVGRVASSTFAATVPSVEPIERATVVRKSSVFAADLCSVVFMFSPDTAGLRDFFV
jgi:hypothetical protein